MTKNERIMTKLRTIALLTDFGVQDVYVGVMKGVIVNINPQIPIIDLTHAIPPQDLIAGRFALLSAYAYFPADTVYVAVVDPGVGSRRRGIAIQFARGFLVGPDNGLFSGILGAQKGQEEAIAAVELTNNLYWRTPNPSTTFHGRDLFASVGAHIANGVNLQELGREISVNSLVSLSLPQVAIAERQIAGCIHYIDRFGNLVTNIAAKNLPPDSRVTIKDRIIPWGQTYSDGQLQELIALIGSHGYLEIAVNCGNAQQKLQVQLGEKVICGWS
jgi:S-adenosyl-L-methionine hydrolase (adenosine-forming)